MDLEEMIAKMTEFKKRTGRAGLAIVSEGIELKGVIAVNCVRMLSAMCTLQE